MLVDITKELEIRLRVASGARADSVFKILKEGEQPTPKPKAKAKKEKPSED